MPYKRKGKTIYSKATGKWRKKQTCKSATNAKKAMALLQGLESGSIKPHEVGKGKFAKPAERSSVRINKLVRKAFKVRA